MKTLAIALSALAIGTAGAVYAQSEHGAHSGAAQHQPGNPGEAGRMPMLMENMPAQCRAMMENMPQDCMSAMQGMMQGGMMQHGAQTAEKASPTEQVVSAARRAYEEAMDRMHGPMMAGIAEEDPDVAFIKGMIPHHRGAIDMAKIVQQYGDDEETKNWAARIIEAQEGEIREMEEWLRNNAP